jgi:hypothetical protein
MNYTQGNEMKFDCQIYKDVHQAGKQNIAELHKYTLKRDVLTLYHEGNTMRKIMGISHR